MTASTNLQDFNEAKNSLINYYSGVQVSLGERILGLGAVLFALFQVTSWSKSGLTAMTTYKISLLIINFPPKLILFFFAVFILILYMVRTGLRYASVSGYLNTIITLEPIKNLESSIHASITRESYKEMVDAKIRVFQLIPFNWFLSGVMSSVEAEARKFNKRSNRRGWAFSMVISFMLSGMLFWVLQEILFPK